MTEARLGYGTLIQYESTPGVFLTVMEAQSIEGPSLTAEDIDVTNHDSAGGFKEFISGLKEGGDVTFNGNLVPENATHQSIINDQKSGIRRNWQIVVPDAVAYENRTVIDFVGYIQTCGFTFPTASQMTYSVTLKVAGEPNISSVWATPLSGMTFADATLIPTYSAATTLYAATTTAVETACTVTFTAGQTVHVTGVTAALNSGSASATIDLDMGLNELAVAVAEDDRKTIRNRVVIVRE